MEAADARRRVRHGRAGMTEQAGSLRWFIRTMAPMGLRVRRDAEGWPYTPGRLGRIEWYCDGLTCHGCLVSGVPALAVFTTRPRMHGRIWAIPGVRRWQSGARETRAVFPLGSLPAVAEQIRAYRRPRLTEEQRAARRHRLPVALKTGASRV
jgi:hypothetical protein